MAHPGADDVVVRHRPGDPSTVHLLGTASAPDQVTHRTRDEAISRAVAYARHQHVRAWLATGDDEFVLLEDLPAANSRATRNVDDWQQARANRVAPSMLWRL